MVSKTKERKMDKATLRTQLRSALLELGIPRLFIFGSVARGEDTNDSDLDILIELDGKNFTTEHVKKVVENKVGRPTDVISMQALTDPMNSKLAPVFTHEVLKDAKVLYA
jgi:predicted nucleotidyltransferase